MAALKDRVVSVIADCVEVPACQIRTDHDLEDALRCDALCRLDLALQIECVFGVSIEGEAGWRTPADVIDAVRQALRQRQGGA